MNYSHIHAQLSDIEAIDFYFASRLYEGMVIDDEPEALYILLALSWSLRHGHTCLSLKEIAESRLFAGEDPHKQGYQFSSMPSLVALAQRMVQSLPSPAALHYEQECLFSDRYWQFEQDIAAAIVSRLEEVSLSDTDYEALSKLWPDLYECSKTHAQDWQQIATALSLTSRFAVITGGPGTGKTYTVSRLLLALQTVAREALDIRLAAPTGKAAQRLSESVAGSLQHVDGALAGKVKHLVPTEAVTVHRLLGGRRYGVATRYHQDNRIHCDVLIIDEASMLDVALMARVCRAVSDDCRIFLIGDPYQLPAVESGNVLEALTSKEKAFNITLSQAAHLKQLCPHLPIPPAGIGEQNFVYPLKVSQRFGGTLADVASAVNSGEEDVAWQSMQDAPEWQDNLLSSKTVWRMSVAIAEKQLHSFITASFAHIIRAVSLEAAMQGLTRCRWLSPTRQGPWGVIELNRKVEAALPIKRELSLREHYPGRPIMITANHYAQQLFNGDIGLIWPDSQGHLKAWFDDPQGGYRSVSLSRLPPVETVFAMTIHKSQGSEFEQVVVWLPKTDHVRTDNVASRELLYTGITRAKQGACVVTDESRFKQVVKTRQQRFSGLRHKIAKQHRTK